MEGVARSAIPVRNCAQPILVFPARSAGYTEGVAALRDPPEKLAALGFPGAKRRYTEGVAALRDPPEKLRAAHEKKRHPPVPVRIVALEPEQQVDGLQQVRLSARGGLAQFCPQALMSRVFQIRVRGNPIRLSNTAGDAGFTLH